MAGVTFHSAEELIKLGEEAMSGTTPVKQESKFSLYPAKKAVGCKPKVFRCHSKRCVLNDCWAVTCACKEGTVMHCHTWEDAFAQGLVLNRSHATASPEGK